MAIYRVEEDSSQPHGDYSLKWKHDVTTEEVREGAWVGESWGLGKQGSNMQLFQLHVLNLSYRVSFSRVKELRDFVKEIMERV